MKAVRIHAYGGPDTLIYEDVPRPQPGAGEVLVRVQAAGVNPVDWKMRQGADYPLPFILGWDFAGVVAELGPGAGASGVAPGEAVYALRDWSGGGAYAEYIAVRADELAPRPATLDPVQAAAVPMAALTAWQALIDRADLSAGQTVLIHGAAGGVGTFAVQIASTQGAHVLATASSRNHDLLRELGAERMIDYTTTRFEEVARNVDMVLDTIGGETRARSWGVLRPGGLLVSTILTPPADAEAPAGVRGLSILVQPSRDELARIGGLIDAGRMRPIVDTVLPLAEARRAHELSQAGHAHGRIVLRVAE
jgi:NADPH:quinone reductase-like Zn-dependent oxidoreductase